MRKHFVRVAVLAGLFFAGVLAGRTHGVAAREARFLPLSLTQLSPEQKKLAELVGAGASKPYDGPWMPLIRSPEAGELIWRLTNYYRDHTSLPKRLNELALLMLAKQWSQQFEWHFHKKTALETGMKSEVIEDIRAGRRPAAMTADETTVYDFVTELRTRRRVSDVTFDAAVALLGERGVMDLIGALGCYDLLAMMLNAVEYPLPPGATQAFPEP